MTVKYREIWGRDEHGNFGLTGQVNLCVLGDLVEADLQEIVTGEYDELHLQFGNFELMERVVNESGFRLKRLTLEGDGSVQDVSWVGQCTDLEYLSLGTKSKGYLDFSNLPKLEDIGAIIWNQTTKDVLTAATGLKRLCIAGFKGGLANFSSDVASGIEDLTVQRGSMTDLAGIEKFVSLTKL